MTIHADVLDQAGSLTSTFSLKRIDGVMVPFQNGIPYPSFEPQQRHVFSLEGEWRKKRFDADHDWSMTLRDVEWIVKTEEDAAGITSLDFDDSHWEIQQLPLPENKMTGKEEVHGAETYENGVWYRKTFPFDGKLDGSVVTLKCMGLSYVGDFWLNGKYVGYHEGGYTPFAFDVTSFLLEGENIMVVRVDNPPWTTRKDIVPAVNNDFFNYTGILQDLYLEVTEAVHIARVDVTPKSISGELAVRVVVENRTNVEHNILLSGKVYDTDPEQDDWLLSPDAKSVRKNEVEVNGLLSRPVLFAPKEIRVITYDLVVPEPKLWSVRQPNLYVFEGIIQHGELEKDAFYTQFGFRTITTDKAQIKLNEQPLFLAGVARHEDWPTFGRTAAWGRIKEDLLIIKDLNVNMVRTAHYPNHIYTFIMLDRLGLTAMSEIPLWQFETEHYLIQEQRRITYQMWREMVYSSYNRPSIIMWSTQNESKDVQLRKKYNEKLVSELRGSYNDGRLVTQSAAADQPGHLDESMEPLDVMGWTMYFGIFHGSTPYEGTRDFLEKAHAKWPEKPIINTEYGIWSNADKSFIDKQVEIYNDVQLALLEKATVSPQGMENEKGYLAGMDYWTAFDWYVNHNDFYQTMGMYHMDRSTKKPLYYRFVEDHRRLLGRTNGLGSTEVLESAEKKLFDIEEKKVEVDRLILSLNEGTDLRSYNYLVLTVNDPEIEEGVMVTLRNSFGKEASYSTFDIKKGKSFAVHIPLWKVDECILRNVASITVQYEEGRRLEVLGLVASVHGKQ